MEDKSATDESKEFKDFLGTVTDEKGNFRDSEENRNAIFDKYRDEFVSYIADKKLPKYLQRNETETPKAKSETPKGKETSSETKKIETKTENLQDAKGKTKNYLRNDELRNEIKKLQSEAVNKGDMGRVAELQSALESNDTAAMEKFVADAGVKLEQNQTQQPEQTETSTQENKKPYQQITDEKQLKAIDLASKGTAGTAAERRQQGRALKFIAEQNGIKIPETLSGALEKGYKGAVKTTQEVFRQKGFLKPLETENIQQLKNELAEINKEYSKESQLPATKVASL